ncbi:YdiY family protein [Planctomycetota bacterium]
MIVVLCLTTTNSYADKIHLKSGDVLEGLVKRKTSDLILFEHGDLGEIWISQDRVDRIEMEEIADPNKPRGFFRKLRYHGWSSTFDLSIDNSFGNTDEQSNRLAYTLNRRVEKNEFDLDMSYYNKVKNSQVTDNKYTLGGAHRWLKVHRAAYWFLNARYDYDEFKSWQSRASLHVGPGYSLVKNDVVDLRGELGAGTRKEWGSINDAGKFEGLFGIIFGWEIMQGQSLDLAVSYMPVYTNFSDYRTRASLNWRLNLNKEATWSILLGMLHEYQSVVDPGIKETDMRTYLGLQVAF